MHANRAHRSLERGFVCVALAAALALTALLPATAQTPSRLDITGVSVGTDRVVAAVAVLDAGGNPVRGLAPNSFTAQVDGSRAEVRGVESSTDSALPLGIVLTVDTSGSMAGASITAAKSALAATVNALGPNDQAALITFAQSVNRAVEPTNDRNALAAAINTMQATGNTALFAGVSSAAAAAAPLTQPRKAVLLLSDGEDFGAASGGVTREQALAAAQAAHAPFFVVGLGAEVDQQFLSSLAESTGGQYFAAATPTELSQLYARISDRLRQQYTLSVALPAGLAPGTHQLSVASGPATARVPFELAAAAAPAKSSFSAIPAGIIEPIVVSVTGAPAGVSPRFTIDGAAVRAESNGHSVRIDPYDWAPATPHTLAVVFPPDPNPAATTTFTAAALPPQVIQPTTLPNLQPGELVRLTLRAQPPGASVRYLVDGVERGRNDAAPYEFVVPGGDYKDGVHELRVIAASAGGETETRFPFEVVLASESGSNLPLILLGAVAAVIALALLVFLVLRLLRRRSEARNAEEAAREVARLSGALVAAPATASVPPWGMLRITEGPDAGRVFKLHADTELIGRGRHCTVRLTDKSLAEEHFILTRDGRIAASSPANVVSVDSRAVRTEQLSASAIISAAGTRAEFVRLASPTP